MKRLFLNGVEIDTFIFDMDGTLFGYDDVVASVNAEFQTIMQINRVLPHAKVQDINAALAQNFDVDRKIWFQKTLGALPSTKLEPAELDIRVGELEQLYWLNFGKYNAPYDDALYFIEQIKPYCRLCMITDGYTYNQKSKLFSSGLHAHFSFDRVLFSDEVGVMKPDPKIFERAFERFEAMPEASAYIGDKINKDIRGANGVGMTSILLRRGHNRFQSLPEPATDTPDIEVTNYFDLLKQCELR